MCGVRGPWSAYAYLKFNLTFKLKVLYVFAPVLMLALNSFDDYQSYDIRYFLRIVFCRDMYCMQPSLHCIHYSVIQ